MSLGIIVAVVVFAGVVYVAWSNRQSSFSKNRLSKNAEKAAHREKQGG